MFSSRKRLLILGNIMIKNVLHGSSSTASAGLTISAFSGALNL
jgi:hypothetical protein